MPRLFAVLSGPPAAVLLGAALALVILFGLLGRPGLDPEVLVRDWPSVGPWVLTLGLDDLGRSPVFLVLLALFAGGLALAVMARLVSFKRLWADPVASRSIDDVAENLLRQEISFKVDVLPDRFVVSPDPADLADPASPPEYSGIETSAHLGCAVRVSGLSGRFGGICLHLGFLVFLGGVAMSQGLGFSWVVRGRAGDQVALPVLTRALRFQEMEAIDRQTRRLAALAPGDPRLGEWRARLAAWEAEKAEPDLDPAFRLLFEDIWVDRPATMSRRLRTAAPGIRRLNARLSAWQGGTLVATAVLRLNEPVALGPYHLYLEDWTRQYRTVILRAEPMGALLREGAESAVEPGPAHTVSMMIGEPSRPTWAPNTLVLEEFLPDFRLEDGIYRTVSDEVSNPAARISLRDAANRTVGRTWAFGPAMAALTPHVSDIPWRFTVLEAQPMYESRVRVMYAPGRPWLILGAVLAVVGFVLVKAVPYREDWILVPRRGELLIAVDGNRPVSVRRRWLQDLALELAARNTPSPPVTDSPCPPAPAS
jgi:hypothetical protein